ncbi:MAG: histidine--tRNA ligase [Candidatus Gribaldobacteria bacterium]|nr:histidine--tRNA ligase [Candidatus Gribaldobacteria bacterium]
MSLKFQTVTGMKDLFETELAYFAKIEKLCQNMADFYGFQKIQTPILEQTELFEKGTGLTTDIVEKEMYSLRTKGGDGLTLRPEWTPAIARAYLQHGLSAWPKPVKLWYLGPCFRHERPQAGRLRQFHQFGFEFLGVQDPMIDALTIQIFYNILKGLGFRNLVVDLNSIGCGACRPYFKKTLNNYLKSRQSSLCADCRVRLKKNPLRVLDCKEEKCEPVKKGAPQMIDHLCKDCHDHFKPLLEYLDELNLSYNLNPYLVRGLDYYTKTVFEIREDTPEGAAQGALAGGGRYDGLVKMLGGKDTPACGAAAGVERIINLLKGDKTFSPKNPEDNEGTAEVFLAQVGDLAKRKALKLLEELRVAKVKVGEGLHKDSLGNQMRLADKMQAKYVLILGQKEALDDEIIIREMKSGSQKNVPLSKVVQEIKKRL